MLKNVGETEKGIRLVLGGLLLVATFVLDLPTWGAAALSVIAIVSLVTGAMGHCPAWTVLGMNTCRTKSTT